MSTGKLRISVFNETVGSPLPNTTVTIFSSNLDNENKVVEEIITNSSGQSDIIELDAPPVEYSFEPGAPRPYSEYTITSKQPGFDPISIRNVQILPDVVAEQNVYMKKPKDMPEENLVYNIPPHTLYKEYPPKIAESPVKELPKPTGLVILSGVVVPEFIVVHDGDPNDNNAPNYWIPYKDYIKNVISSEVYATWPEESLRANILVVISFTLNRVYTEWYRSRGKNFTITSSTAYDQKFVYQRNIFQEVSTIVDEIFSTYITKPNIKQPLFTQYCDGKNVTCPGWLEQWQSKTLAENGMGYIQILKNYYGSEIFLESATQVTGVPVSFAGKVLQMGSQGKDVSTIQGQLNSISNKYPAISKIAVDSVYGQSTVDAVKKFQQIFGLPQTGSVDYATWYEISKVYTAAERLT